MFSIYLLRTIRKVDESLVTKISTVFFGTKRFYPYLHRPGAPNDTGGRSGSLRHQKCVMTFLKTFAKALLANFLATCVIVLFFLFVVGGVSLSSLAFFADGDHVEQVVDFSSDQPKVLSIILRGKLGEKARHVKGFDTLGFLERVLHGKQEKKYGLLDYLLLIESAKDNEKIQGISLEIRPSFQTNGLATLSALRDALLAFKESGRFLHCYLPKSASESIYYLASVSDNIAMSPSVRFELDGLHVSSLFYKEMMDKYGIEAEVVRAGEFKGAVEPYTRKNFSRENRQQIESVLNTLYDDYLLAISNARGVSVYDLRTLAERAAVQDSRDALRTQLIDTIVYPSDYKKARNKLFKQQFGIEDKAEDIETAEGEGIVYVKLLTYDKAFNVLGAQSARDHQIAVVVAEGVISSDGEEGISYKAYKKVFSAIRKEDKIKAVVVRINSPGGSARASDFLWREIKLTAEKVPVIASMGDISASGGYYMAVACDAILAEKNTITGSIGAFNLSFSVQDFLLSFGVHYDAVKTNPHADMRSFRSSNKEELLIAQRNIRRVYETFVKRVAVGRSMSKEEVLATAGGRIWTAEVAQKKGLLDGLGGWKAAVQLAAEKASISQKDYQIVYYPKYVQEWKMYNILPYFLQHSDASLMGAKQATLLEHFQREMEAYREGAQTRMLYDFSLN